MDGLMYQEGFKYAFNPKACQSCEGKCCIGESGYIWVSQEEIEAIAEKLLLSKESFINNYLLKIRYRFTIKEIAYEGGYGCVFFDREKKMCTIYDVRPSQCRTFPFWEYFKENIDEVVSECPGIIRL
ncbi:YkgJ family cysteine cluster protein [Sulfurospirillum barnesii]|uniref:Putative Fe-S oxidoreductase n=1 Tax=Sulfurospirillum barnesii (strain ATCC 700032 / DSM 10660 / SES-3) TaxID=760154 RepID=I3XXB0_SULBS|nr:YkgJ family cysteine cluster protein [Sulfurospirillum barnesii]AFL68584.1 putative Fe-S oxidoreductase [Sulfurospirillum barnesii SES-3]